MKLAKWIFLSAGVLGLVSIIPIALAAGMIAVQQPAFFYGFLFLNISFDILYIFIYINPVRYRPIMIPSFLAKASSSITLIWLYSTDQVSFVWITFASLDGIFAVLFLVALGSSFIKSQNERQEDNYKV